MVFNPVGAGIGVVGTERRAEFPRKIPLVAAVIITADPVAVVAVQALVIIWVTGKAMALHGVVFKGKMAGGAAGAVFCFRVWSALIVEMAAQAASSQHVVCQGQGGGWRFFYLDVDERVQGVGGSKGFSDFVDHLGDGEVGGFACGGGLLLVAASAGVPHVFGMGGEIDQVVVGCLSGVGGDVAVVAGRAGEVMHAVQLHGVASLTSWRVGGFGTRGDGLFFFTLIAARKKG